MQFIGSIEDEKISDYECSFDWRFSKVVFNKSYGCSYRSFPNADVDGYHLAIVPDEKRDVVGFYIFLLGYEKLQRGVKITVSASLGDRRYPRYTVSCSNVCLDLEPSIKLFEIHSSHPIFFNCLEYALKFRAKMHEDLMVTSKPSNTSEDVTERGNVTSSGLFIKQKRAKNVLPN